MTVVGAKSAPRIAKKNTHAIMTTTHLQQLLTTFPTATGDVQAVLQPDWDDLSHLTQDITPGTPGQAITRYLHREAAGLHADAVLEGMTGITHKEVQRAMRGQHLPSRSDGENHQLQDLRKASRYMIYLAEQHPQEPGLQVSDDLHVCIGGSLAMPSIQFRGDQDVRYFGPVVQLGGGETFRALDARLCHPVCEAGLQRIRQITHPVLRGATWAAFATYHQFYFDGNKRSGRYTMNTVLLSHGYDSILIPHTRKDQYIDAVVAAYRTGNLTPHIEFLLHQYPA